MTIGSWAKTTVDKIDETHCYFVTTSGIISSRNGITDKYCSNPGYQDSFIFIFISWRNTKHLKHKQKHLK